ncbi:oxidized purine nucleoside triphosphate hydrolase [Plutella xylostella]|uniref:oxidized purine nucleoside triphosphate hydrolase n=1 Tax=Plutella xylostella TaxID=51655 RepID=UPI002032444A|nr:oxidized purine nucleoside triphosphate hydrolase [Plutella xylostella]
MLLKKLYTLVFLRTDTAILLGLKKRGFGCNKWNGFGGKIEPKETVIEAALRELYEECCVTVKPENLQSIGQLEFTFEGDPMMMDVRVYSAKVFEGTPTETEEMNPKWFPYDQIPFKDMWLDDALWFPYMLKGQPFYGKFHYQGFDKILHYTVEELDSMEQFYLKYK